MKYLLIFLVHVYRWTLAPLLVWLGGGTSGCRFTPSCSQFALDALRAHGAIRGSWLTVRRLARCHPWGGSGHDPVPAAAKPDACAAGCHPTPRSHP